MDDKQSNRTEVDPTSEETTTPKYQHLAPALHAGDAGLPGDKMVTVIVPKAFNITLSDGTRQRVSFTPGTYQIPARFLKHYYLKANGVQVPTETVIEKPETEDAPDYSKLTRADLAGMKFDQLGAVCLALKIDADPLKSKAERADAIATKLELPAE